MSKQTKAQEHSTRPQCFLLLFASRTSIVSLKYQPTPPQICQITSSTNSKLRNNGETNCSFVSPLLKHMTKTFGDSCQCSRLLVLTLSRTTIQEKARTFKGALAFQNEIIKSKRRSCIMVVRCSK